MSANDWAVVGGWSLALVATLGMLALGAKVEQLRALLRDATSGDQGADCPGRRGDNAGCMDRDCRGRDA